MIHKAKKETVFIHSMGKRFKIEAIATTVEEANSLCEKNSNLSVMAEFGPFVFLCNRYDGVKNGNDKG